MQLQIWHVGEADGKPLFEVRCDGQQGKAVILTPPSEIIVTGYKESLPQGLRWYMESYLELPTGAFLKHAQAVLDSLRAWGQDGFEALFDSGGPAQRWYDDACQDELQIKIVSHCDDPMILAWPWEALESRQDGYLAQQYHMERQLNDVGRPKPQKQVLSTKQLNYCTLFPARAARTMWVSMRWLDLLLSAPNSITMLCISTFCARRP